MLIKWPIVSEQFADAPPPLHSGLYWLLRIESLCVHCNIKWIKLLLLFNEYRFTWSYMYAVVVIVELQYGSANEWNLFDITQLEMEIVHVIQQ